MNDDEPISAKSPGTSKLGLAVGFSFGISLSILLIGLQHHAMFHARLYMNVARAMAAHDARLGMERLEEFERHFKANRFMEKSHMLTAPAKLRICGAAALRDKDRLNQTVTELSSQRERILQTVDGKQNLISSPSGIVYPLSSDSEWEIRVTMVSENWGRAIQLADAGLEQARAYWDDVGGTPPDPDHVIHTESNTGSKTTVETLKNRERRFVTCRAWAQAQLGKDELALADTDLLLDEPLTWQTPEGYIVPEVRLFRAALLHRLGQTEAAVELYAEAIASRSEPAEFGPKKSRQIPPRQRLVVGKTETIDESWKLFREHQFGLPPWWAVPKSQAFSFVTSLRDRPADLVDELIREQQRRTE